MSKSPKISIIVPVYTGGKHFDICLQSLTQVDLKPHEIIIVGDGEGDGSWRKADTYGFRGICQETQGGPAKARNFGATVATGEWLLFLDADVEASPNLISIAQKSITQYSDTDAFIGSYDDSPGDTGFLSQYRNLLHHFVHQEAGSEASTFWGACGLIRKSAFEKVGGFDAKTYTAPSIEDIELGYRLKRADMRIRHQNDLLVKHWKRWTAIKMLRTDLFQRAVLWTKLILQTKESHYELNLGLKYRIGLVCSFLILFAPIVLIFSPFLALTLSLICAIFYLWIHARLFHFLKNKKGLYFTVKSAFWRWVYDLCSGLGFIIGYTSYLSSNSK
jgi:glycosyltransferase involved in cell wall biosynthesis